MIKKIASIVMVALLLVACGTNSSSKEKTKTCSFDSGASGIVKKVTITYDGKDVSSIKFTDNSKLPEYLFEEQSKEELEKQYSNSYISSEDQKGITSKISIDEKEKSLNVELEIDTKKVSMQSMTRLEFKEYKNLDDFTKSLEEKGYSCK